MFSNLTEDNVILYAMKHYENSQCLSEVEFHNDLKIIKYIKRLFNRYKRTGEIKERLMLNHLSKCQICQKIWFHTSKPIFH